MTTPFAPTSDDSAVVDNVGAHQFVRAYSPTPSWGMPPAEAATPSAELLAFHKPLAPDDYNHSRAFANQVLRQVLETVDQRRPLAHLRSFTTPTILDMLQQRAQERAEDRNRTAASSTSSTEAAQAPAPLRLMRLHLRARRLTTEESTAARHDERNLPPGFQAAVRPGASRGVASTSSRTSLPPDLRLEICGTYRDKKRVCAFAGAATRCEGQWRLIDFNFV